MKNLKMFAIAVMAFAVMAMGVRAETCLDDDLVAARYNGADHCNVDVAEAISEAEAAGATELTVTLLKDVTEDSDVTLTANKIEKLTIKLSGHDYALGTQKIEVGKDQTVEIQGEGDFSGSAAGSLVEVALGGTFKTSGKLDINATNNFVQLTGGTTGSAVATLEIGEGANVTAKTGITTATSSNNVKATINGTWVTTDEVVNITGGTNVAGKIANVTINGTLTSSTKTAISLGGYVNVALNATVTGAAVSNGGALYVASSGASINITGGKYVAKADNTTATSAITINGSATDTTLKISCGEFVASKAGKVAISFGSEAAVNNNKGNITGGTFQYGLTDQTSSYTVEEAIKLLTGTESYTIGEDKTVTLACGTQNPSDKPGSTEPEQQPGTTEPGDQTIGDGNQGSTENVKNPNTNDNILVYAGLGLVSLTSVAFTARKRED